MYQFSRSMYRELAEFVVPDQKSGVIDAKARLLSSCEAAVERLATDRHYFARPTRSLFNDVRMLFPLKGEHGENAISFINYRPLTKEQHLHAKQEVHEIIARRHSHRGKGKRKREDGVRKFYEGAPFCGE